MSKSEAPPESPVQIHLRSGTGAVMTFDLPLSEHVQRQYDNGELTRVNVDGSPYTGTEPPDELLEIAPHAVNLDEFERIVAVAETEAREAADLARALEDRVKDGDESVTPEALESARQLQGFAKLRKTAAERKAARARETERQRQLAALREEIETTSPTTRAELVELLKAAETATAAFVEACGKRNALIQGWYDRMRGLGVERLTTPQPPAEHQRLAWDDSGVLLVGKFPPARYSSVHPDGFVRALADQAGHGRPINAELYKILREES